MQSMITGSPLADVMIAAGTALAAVLGVILARARKEPPKPGSPDASVAALMENTDVLKQLVGLFADMRMQFGSNMDQFVATNLRLDDMLRETRQIREAAQASKEHLNIIRERQR